MTEQNNRPQDRKRIDDEEGEVDSRFKTRIIQNRIRVDEAEEKLFLDATTDPNLSVPRQQAVSIWGTMVKQYLRTIEPILSSDEVEDAQKYYKDIEIGSVTLVPPDKEGYEFSMVRYAEMTDQKLRKALSLPKSAEIPKPHNIQFNGLLSIIEAPDVLSHRWVVTVDDTGAPPTHERVVLEQSRIPDKQLYVDALRHADQFLQGAGLGIDIKPEGVPEFGFVEVGSNGA